MILDRVHFYSTWISIITYSFIQNYLTEYLFINSSSVEVY